MCFTWRHFPCLNIQQWFILSLFIVFLHFFPEDGFLTIWNELLCSKLHPKLASSCKGRKCQWCEVNWTDLCMWNHLQSHGEAHFFHFSCRFCHCRPSPRRLMINCHTPLTCVRSILCVCPALHFSKMKCSAFIKDGFFKVFWQIMYNFVQKSNATEQLWCQFYQLCNWVFHTKMDFPSPSCVHVPP